MIVGNDYRLCGRRCATAQGKKNDDPAKSHRVTLPSDGILTAKHMPKGPKGQKRPADVISNAVHVMRIATGEITETPSQQTSKNAAAVELGRIGGRARARKLSGRKKSEIATNAAEARWSKTRRRQRGRAK
jgi:hypothetical protein